MQVDRAPNSRDWYGISAGRNICSTNFPTCKSQMLKKSFLKNVLKYIFKEFTYSTFDPAEGRTKSWNKYFLAKHGSMTFRKNRMGARSSAPCLIFLTSIWPQLLAGMALSFVLLYLTASLIDWFFEIFDFKELFGFCRQRIFVGRLWTMLN